MNFLFAFACTCAYLVTLGLGAELSKGEGSVSGNYQSAVQADAVVVHSAAEEGVSSANIQVIDREQVATGVPSKSCLGCESGSFCNPVCPDHWQYNAYKSTCCCLGCPGELCCLMTCSPCIIALLPDQASCNGFCGMLGFLCFGGQCCWCAPERNAETGQFGFVLDRWTRYNELLKK